MEKIGDPGPHHQHYPTLSSKRRQVQATRRPEKIWGFGPEDARRLMAYVRIEAPKDSVVELHSTKGKPIPPSISIRQPKRSGKPYPASGMHWPPDSSNSETR